MRNTVKNPSCKLLLYEIYIPYTVGIQSVLQSLRRGMNPYEQSYNTENGFATQFFTYSPKNMHNTHSKWYVPYSQRRC